MGLVVLVGYHSWIVRRDRQLLSFLHHPHSGSFWTGNEQLHRAIAHYHETEQQLQAQLQTRWQTEATKWQSILEAAPVGYLQVDEENQLLWCNGKASQLLGLQQWDSATPRLLLGLVRSFELDQLIEQTRDRQQPQHQEWIWHATSTEPEHLAHQSPCALRGYGLPLPDAQVGVFLEERQEVHVLRQQRDRWASDVAHELKTPLTSIRLVAETLQERLPPALQYWMQHLLREVIRLSDLVQDLLDLGRLEKGALSSLTLIPVDLVALIHSTWETLEPLAQQKNVTLHYVGPPALMFKGDKFRLYRVLINLLDNSLKYSPPHHAIHVHLQKVTADIPAADETDSLVSYPVSVHPVSVHLEVFDSGPGFPEGALPHVFERFYRADDSRYQAYEASLPIYGRKLSQRAALHPQPMSTPTGQRIGSSGLGLAIVRQIVEAHEGSVRASNHPSTGGAWLYVTLPCRDLEC